MKEYTAAFTQATSDSRFPCLNFDLYDSMIFLNMVMKFRLRWTLRPGNGQPAAFRRLPCA